MSKLSEQISIILQVVDNTKGRLKKTSREIKELGDAGKKGARGIDKTKVSARKAGKAIEKTGKQADKTTKKVKKLGKSAKGLKTSFAGAAAGLATFAGAAAAIALPVLEAAKFERKMAEVKTIAGATDEEFKRMTETARNLGRTTEFSAQQAAEGFKFLAMAGLTADQAISALPTALNLAIVGVIELGEAADFVTNIMGGMRLAVEDIPHIADVIGKTATSTNSSVSELATSMSYAAPMAAAMGVSLEETAAAMGILHDNGMKGSRAGTAVRGMLADLAAPTAKATAALHKLGVQIAYNADGSLNLEETFTRLKEAGMGAGEAARIFGTMQAASALALAENTKKLRDLTIETANADGTMNKMAADMNATAVGAFKNLKSAISGANEAVGQQFLNSLTLLMNVIASSINGIVDFTKEHEVLMGWVLKLGGAFVAFIGTLALVRVAMMGVGAVMKISGLTNLIAGIGQLATAMLGASAAAKTLAIAMRLTGIGVIVGTTVAVIGATKAFFDMKKAQDMAKESAENAAAANKRYTDRLKRASEAAGVTLKNWKEVRKAYADGLIDYDKATDTYSKGSGKAREAYKQTIGYAKEAATKQKEFTQDQLDSMTAKWKEYAKEIKKLQGDIAGKQRSMTRELREMGRSGTSDLFQWKDRLKEAQEYFRESEKAMNQAKKLAEAGETDAAKETFDVAKEYAKNAQEGFKSLNEEVKKGDKILISQQAAKKIAMKTFRQAGELEIKILREQQTALKQASDELNKKSGSLLSDKYYNEQKQKTKEVGQEVVKVGDEWIGVQKTATNSFLIACNSAIGNVKRVRAEIGYMKADMESVKFNVGQRTGGIAGVPAFADGGYTRRAGALPGFGGGDRIRAMLEAGEFIMRKEAVRKYGLDLMFALNSGALNLGNALRANLGGLIPSVPASQPIQMKSGGAVPSASSESFTVNLNLPTEGRTVQTTMPRGELSEFFRQINSINRRASN